MGTVSGSLRLFFSASRVRFLTRVSAMRRPVAVKPMLVWVRNSVLLAGWPQQQFEQPNHWSLDSFSCGTYGLNVR